MGERTSPWNRSTSSLFSILAAAMTLIAIFCNHVVNMFPETQTMIKLHPQICHRCGSVKSSLSVLQLAYQS
jgi:hypothetical protein